MERVLLLLLLMRWVASRGVLPGSQKGREMEVGCPPPFLRALAASEGEETDVAGSALRCCCGCDRLQKAGKSSR